MSKRQAPPSVAGNIWKLYAIQALTQALFAIAVIVLFWQSHGLSFRQMLLLQAIFAATILLLEIPTGYLADRWGRKRTLMLAGVFDVLAYAIYAQSTGFWTFLLAEVSIAIGASLRSGAVEAITYDSLLELRQEQSYRRIAGNQNFLEFNTEALAGLAGAALATINLALPLWVTVIPMSMALILACTLREPARHVQHETRHWAAIWNVATHTLVTHRGLRGIILIYGLISTLSLTFFWFFQPYQTLVGVPLVLLGLTHAITLFVGALSAKAVPWFEGRMDDRILLMAAGGIAVLCCFALQLPPALWVLSLFALSRLAWHGAGPLTSDMLNRMTTSDVRATVLSLRSFVGRLLFVCTAPFIGILADARSPAVALLVMGIGGGVALLLVFLSMRTVWKEIPA